MFSLLKNNNQRVTIRFFLFKFNLNLFLDQLNSRLICQILNQYVKSSFKTVTNSNWCVFCYEFYMKDLELLCNSNDFIIV
jgi:hypothetical protein